MADNILRLPFVGYPLGENVARICESFFSKYGEYPSLLIYPEDTIPAHIDFTLLTDLGVEISSHPSAHGMWYAGPIPRE
jgi:hypothetical protein